MQRDPATTTSNPNQALVGEVFQVDYDIEGSDVGYRWFAREDLRPDFPFGWGLSYTTFAFTGLDVVVDGPAVRVSGTFKNTGGLAEAAAPQVYVSRTERDGMDFVPRLAGFTRIQLDAGESRSVQIALEPRILARWDATDGVFRIAGGKYSVRVSTHALDEDGPAAGIELVAAPLP